jgi:hypothetical protein
LNRRVKVVATVAALAAVAWIGFMASTAWREKQSSQFQIVTDGPVKIYADIEHNSASTPIAVLRRGETLPIFGCVYSKDFLNYRIRLAGGSTGYLMLGSAFHVVGRDGAPAKYPQDLCV